MYNVAIFSRTSLFNPLFHYDYVEFGDRFVEFDF